MDGKSGSGRPAGNGRSRKHKSVLKTLKDFKQIVAFLKAHRSALLAGFLITAMVVLLFGIVSQLQAPSTENAPGGEMPINYSTFLNQVNSNNVLAVSMNGYGVNALLQQPIGNATTIQKSVPLSVAQRTKDVETWTRYISSLNTTNWTAQTNFEAGRLVYTNIPAGGSDQLVALLVSKHATVLTQTPKQMSAWVGILLKFAPLLFLLLLLAIVLKPRNRGRIPHNVNEQIAHFTKKRVRRYERPSRSKTGQDRQVTKTTIGTPKGGVSRSVFTPSSSVPTRPARLAPPTTFADVAGIDEVRTELEEIVQFLRSPEKFERLGARIPRGALLVGPPGTGKTLLARAVAGEAGVPFFSMSASEFVEMFVGVGASRVRDLFNQARQAAPSVIFIDEIDAVGRKRSVRAMGNDERDQTLNQLLVELDGFNARQAVVVMAATNRVDILDKALLRPGRFDRHITVSPPDRIGREAILHIHSAKTPLHPEVSLERLARMTTGMSGADLANLVNEAALCAARKDLEHVDNDCFEEALARVQLGALRPLVMTEAERQIIAYHESGHALVAHYLQEADTVNRVTILPRGQSLGVTQFIAEEDRYNYSREMLMAKIAVGLGGRTAEELTLGRERVTTGAENDFQVVTGMARRMVTRWGMSDEVGVIFTDYDETGAGLNMRRLDPSTLSLRSQTLAYAPDGRLVPNGEPDLAQQYALAMTASTPISTKSTSLAMLVDREVKKILDEAHTMAQNILQEHFDQLQLLADTLMEREQLNRAEFEELIEAN
jgi:ATP-dependent metalloprotease FtsH